MSRDGTPGFDELVNSLLRATWFPSPLTRMEFDGLTRQTNLQVLDGLLRLAVDTSVDPSARAVALNAVMRIRGRTEQSVGVGGGVQSFLRLARMRIDNVLDDPSLLESAPAVVVPPGSPIGGASGDSAGWVR